MLGTTNTEYETIMLGSIRKIYGLILLLVILTRCNVIPLQKVKYSEVLSEIPTSTNTCIPAIKNNTIAETIVPSMTINYDDKLIFSILIKGCAAKENDQDESKNDGKDREPEIKVTNNSIYYDRAIHHLCCLKVDISYEIIPYNNIRIYENWSGGGCRCVCFTEIGIAITNVPRGQYIVSVYEVRINPMEQNPMKKTPVITE